MFNLKVDMIISYQQDLDLFLLVWVFFRTSLRSDLTDLRELIIRHHCQEDGVISVRRKSDKIFGLLLTIIGELSIVVTCKVADVNDSNSRPVN